MGGNLLFKTKITVVIPIYNASQTLGRAINSVLGQTFKDFELILINDGSTDDSINICKELLTIQTPESLMDMKEDDRNLQQFLYVFSVLQEFESNKTSYYLGSYLVKFLFDVRQKYFEMPARDYYKLTSNFKYQSNALLNYFRDLKIVLEEVKDLFLIIAPNLD